MIGRCYPDLALIAPPRTRPSPTAGCRLRFVILDPHREHILPRLRVAQVESQMVSPDIARHLRRKLEPASSEAKLYAGLYAVGMKGTVPGDVRVEKRKP